MLKVDDYILIKTDNNNCIKWNQSFDNISGKIYKVKIIGFSRCLNKKPVILVNSPLNCITSGETGVDITWLPKQDKQNNSIVDQKYLNKDIKCLYLEEGSFKLLCQICSKA